MAFGFREGQLGADDLNGQEIFPKGFADLPDDSGESLHQAELPDDSGVSPPDAPPLEASKAEGVKEGGGSYKDVRNHVDTNARENKEVHHMPSDYASPLERNDGPCIEMDRSDHRQTASCGNSVEAREYREKQKELIAQGKFRDALQMDIDDIQEKFGDKYDVQIQEMLAYVDQLEQEGKING